MENAKKVIPAVEVDSRLGWEPSMEYVCDPWHLDWKLRQMDHTLTEVAAFRRMTHLHEQDWVPVWFASGVQVAPEFFWQGKVKNEISEYVAVSDPRGDR